MKHLITLIVFASALAVNAATYYVAPGNPTDLHTGSGTIDDPWINFADTSYSNHAVPGDTILWRGGTYSMPYHSWWNHRVVVRGDPDNWLVLKNYPGEIPVLDGELTGSAGFFIDKSSYVIVEGFIFKNFELYGVTIGNGPKGNDCDNVIVRYCIADMIGKSGFDNHQSEKITIEYCAAGHMGHGDPTLSWTSGVNFHKMNGGGNVARGVVSFNNVDISSHNSDGKGFIFDIPLGEWPDNPDTIVNCIAFENGGSGIGITRSDNVIAINNTCFNNTHKNGSAEFTVCMIPKDALWPYNVQLTNNLALAKKNGFKTGCSSDFTEDKVQTTNNSWQSMGSADQYVKDAPLDFTLPENSPVIDKGMKTDYTPSHDIGLDPNVIIEEQQFEQRFWKHGFNYDYVMSKNELKELWNPVPRTIGGAPDLGAYEYNDGSYQPVSISWLNDGRSMAPGNPRKNSPARFVAMGGASTPPEAFAPDALVKVYDLDGRTIATVEGRGLAQCLAKLPSKAFMVRPSRAKARR